MTEAAKRERLRTLLDGLVTECEVRGASHALARTHGRPRQAHCEQLHYRIATLETLDDVKRNEDVAKTIVESKRLIEKYPVRLPLASDSHTLTCWSAARLRGGLSRTAVFAHTADARSAAARARQTARVPDRAALHAGAKVTVTALWRT